MVKNKLNVKLKACPRCGGDLYFGGDRYGDYEGCVQCGFMKDLGMNAKVGVGIKSSYKEVA